MLSTQLVYQGLIDEIFGVNCGFVDFGADVTGEEKAPRVKLSAEEDGVFALIRDLNFSKVGPLLNKKVDIQVNGVQACGV